MPDSAGPGSFNFPGLPENSFETGSLLHLPVPMKIQLEYVLLIRSRTPALGSVSRSGMAHWVRPDTWDRYAISKPWGIVLLEEGQ